MRSAWGQVLAELTGPLHTHRGPGVPGEQGPCGQPLRVLSLADEQATKESVHPGLKENIVLLAVFFY